jgi:hypothetical protein
LVTVVTELSNLQAALSAVDNTTSLVGADQSSIHARVKSVNGVTYVIASNTTASSVSTTFSWHSSISGAITVHNENRTVSPNGAQFTDTFGPYAAHVYEIVEP